MLAARLEHRDETRWEDWCARRRTSLAAQSLVAQPPPVVAVSSDDVIDLRATEPVVWRADEPSTAAPERPTYVASRTVVAAAVLIVVLNVLDIITTRLALGSGGTEANPVAALFVEFLPVFVAIKVALPLSVALRIQASRHRTTPMLLAAMWWVVGVYSMTVVVNALHLIG